MRADRVARLRRQLEAGEAIFAELEHEHGLKPASEFRPASSFTDAELGEIVALVDAGRDREAQSMMLELMRGA